jgi:hypothetical protein
MLQIRRRNDAPGIRLAGAIGNIDNHRASSGTGQRRSRILVPVSQGIRAGNRSLSFRRVRSK